MRALLLLLALALQQDAPKQEPVAVPVRDKDGWTRVENAKDKIGLSIPTGWEAWDLSSEELTALVDKAGENNTSIKEYKKDIMEMAKDGMYKLVVVQAAPNSLKRPFMNNAYLMSAGLPQGITFAMIVDQSVSDLGGKKSVKRRKFGHPRGEAEELITELPATLQDNSSATILTIRNFILNGSTLYVLTFSILKEELKSIRPTIDKIRDSLTTPPPP